MTIHRAVRASLLAASLTAFGAACGTNHPAADAAPGSPGHAPAATATAPASPEGARIGGRVVYFSASAGSGSGGHEVLTDRSGLDRFAAQFAGREATAAQRIAAAGRATDFSREVLVGWTRNTGCGAASSATLTASGKRLVLQVDQPKPPPECLVANHVTVVFAVPRGRLPEHPAFG